MNPCNQAPLPLGTETPHGVIVGIRYDGERYYIMQGECGVALMPADVVEKEEP